MRQFALRAKQIEPLGDQLAPVNVPKKFDATFCYKLPAGIFLKANRHKYMYIRR